MIRKNLFMALCAMMMVFAGTVMARVEIDRTGSFKITYSSSIGSNENGERVFDDTTATKWLTAGGQTTGWIQFDFSEEDAFAINGYTITGANDAPGRSPKNWTLQGSNDGTTWAVVDTRIDETGWSTFQKRSYSFTNTTAYKMYKLDVTANNGDGGLMGFSELELLDGTVDRTAMPGTITASSQIGDKEWPYAVFDGTDQTKWLTGFTTTGWIVFDFTGDAAYAVNGYTITSANDSPDRTPKNWALEGSNDGASWTAVDARTNETGWVEFQKRSYVFTNRTAYKMYRLNVTANNGSGNLMGFSELQLLEIQDDPTIVSMSPANFNSTSANPLVLAWDSVFGTASATYTIHFGTDPNFVNAGTIETAGVTAKQWTVPESSITDDSIYYWRADVVDDPYGTGIQTYTGPVVKFRVLRQVQKVLEWSMDNYGAGTTYSYERPIPKITATASSMESLNRSPDRTVGLNGINIDLKVLDPNGLGHSNNAYQMWISDPAQVGTVWIQYAFEQAYAIGTMYVWNHNVGDPYLAELNRGMRDVIVSYSQDGTTWTALGNYTIPMGTGLANMPPSIGIPFGGIEAKYVRITAAASNSNWGASGHHALSEVRFGMFNQPVISYVMPDTSGMGNDGLTYVDPELVAEAIDGQAIDLTGNDMIYMDRTDPNLAVTLPLGADESCYNSWTLNFYALLPVRSPDLSFVVGFGDFNTGTGRYIAQFSDGIHFWGGDNIDGVTNVPFDLNRWQMITATYDGRTLRIYKNATSILEQVTSLGIAVPKVSVSGMSPWGPAALVGLVDEFTLYKGALSQAEIDLLNAALPTQYAALNPVPANGAEDVGVDPVLSWDAPLSAIDPTYDVYLGTDENNLLLVASGLTKTTLDTIPLGLSYETTYYWYVDTQNGDISATWSFTTMPATSAAALALGWDFENLTVYQQEYEQAIGNIAVTASSQEADWRAATSAANGIGLFVDPFIPDANSIGLKHSNNTNYMWICDPAQTGKVWIKFGFDQSYQVGTMLVWNHNVGDPYLAELNRGMRQVTVKYCDTDSTDPNAWTVLGNYEIPIGTGQDNVPPSLGIDFGGIETRYVMIEAADTAVDPNSNWGAAGNFHALSEVRFGKYGTTAVSSVVPDTSGNGNVGVVYGTPEFVPGISGGQSVKIDSQDFYGYGDSVSANITNAAAIPLAAGDQWSMNLYVYLPANPPSPTLFAGFGGTNSGSGRYVGRFYGVHFWGGDNIDVSSSKQYRYGHWQMVTVVYDGSTLRLYHNGVEIGSGTPPAGYIVDASQYVAIAGLNPWGNRMNGRVDDFMLYRGILSRGEIAALAAAIPMEGDMDWNDTVNLLDLSSFVADWLAPYDCTRPSDFTGDCRVTLDDFAVVAENWLKVQ